MVNAGSDFSSENRTGEYRLSRMEKYKISYRLQNRDRALCDPQKSAYQQPRTNIRPLLLASLETDPHLA